MSESNTDENGYKDEVIASSTKPSKKVDVASKTGTFRRPSEWFQPKIQPPASTAPATATSFDADGYSKEHEDFEIDQANVVSITANTPTQRERMAPPAKPARVVKKTAIGQLSEKANQVTQDALLKTTKARIKDEQMSLFDLAPWADDMRAMPNDIARTALFTTRNKRAPRRPCEGLALFVVQKDVKITYTGIELRAEDDELVWLQVLEYAKRIPIGTPVTFTFYELCKDLDWSINGRYYDKVESCLSRLQATAMQFSSSRVGQLESVSLIHRFRVLDRGTKSSRCQVEIDEEMVVLFAGSHYTKFVWEKYRVLSPTARRMFDNFASHREPFPIKLETFRLMCGSDSERLKKWTEQTNKACDELNKSGLVKCTWVAGNLIYCER